jgi:D-galactarolactone cycloisomerase
MKISAIEIKHYAMPLDPPFRAAWDPQPRTSFSATIVWVHTDQGLSGVGSGDMMLGIKGHEHLFIGRDPLDIERHWQILDNLDFHYGRPWPLDLALWDLAGKIKGASATKLLGAKTSRILAYASTGVLMDADQRADHARELLNLGFKAIKIRFHHQDPKDDLQVVRKLRATVGPDIEIMVDANQGWRMPWDTKKPWDLDLARNMADALAELKVYWLEEPLAHYDFKGMAALRKHSRVRIAGGEMNRRWHDYRELSQQGCLDVYQPDAALCGGISGVRRIAQMVQAGGAWFSPHTWTNGIGVLANLHLSLAVSKCPFIELPYDPPTWSAKRRDFMIMPEDRLAVDSEGCLNLPPKAGLGFELDSNALARYEL